MNIGRFVDRSGSVAAGGTAVTAMAENLQRKWVLVQNPADATEVLYVDIGAAASTTAKTSIELVAGGSFSMDATFCGIGAVSVNAVTNGHKFIAKEGV